VSGLIFLYSKRASKRKAFSEKLIRHYTGKCKVSGSTGFLRFLVWKTLGKVQEKITYAMYLYVIICKVLIRHMFVFKILAMVGIKTKLDAVINDEGKGLVGHAMQFLPEAKHIPVLADFAIARGMTIPDSPKGKFSLHMTDGETVANEPSGSPEKKRETKRITIEELEDSDIPMKKKRTYNQVATTTAPSPKTQKLLHPGAPLIAVKKKPVSKAAPPQATTSTSFGSQPKSLSLNPTKEDPNKCQDLVCKSILS